MRTKGGILRYVPVTLVMGTIFFLSHQPAAELRLPPFFGLDKVAHAVAYAALAGTLLYGLEPDIRSRKPQIIGVTVILFCLFFGITDELHQSFIPGRVPSVADLLADVAGAALVVFGWFRRRARQGRRQIV